MPKRSYSAAGSYRFGFNGKENDNEVKGLGNQQDYGMRIYDARLGRFLSVDPLTSSFPWYTPYQFAGNSPIANIDLDGLEPVPSVSPDQKEGDKTQTTSEVSTPGGQPGCTDCTTKTEVKVWYFHAGGLRQESNNPVTGAASYTQAGWYSSEDYARVLSTSRAATSLALRLNLYSSELHPRITESVEDLSNFISGGLSENAEKHLIAAASIKASNANAGRTGLINMSSFNVEDILGVGILLKQGIKVLGSYAANNLNRFLVDRARKVLSAGGGRNIGILSGTIEGEGYFAAAASGQAARTGAVKNPVLRRFTTKEVGGYDRLFDSEVKLLEDFAEKFHNKPNVKGILTLTSEKQFCPSCEEVIKQFKNMFPNVELNLTNGVK